MGTKTGTDVDDDTLAYTITAGNDGGLFAMNSTSGAITVASGLNHETASSHSLTVQAADAALSATATVTVTVGDVNEVPSISASTYTIAENASVGATVGTKTGTDVDDDTLAYTITAGNDGGLFAMNSTSGAITVASGLNHETASSHSLTVQAADAALSATATVTVTVGDVNEVPSISASTYTIAENASVGATVGTKTGTDVDDDTLAYTITAGNDGGLFAMNSTSGAITVASGLNHETASSHSLTVQAADAALSATATVIVNVTDVNEVPSISASSFTIAEDASVGAEVGTKTGTDVDDDTLAYTITAGNDGGLFAMNSTSGLITVASGLNHEEASSHSLTVQAADAALSATATVTVTVSDVTEAPSISSSTFTIAENASVGAEVGTKTGTDVDDGDTLSYSITDGNDDGLFTINSGSGLITVASGLNHEAVSSHSLAVTATDTSSASATATVTVNVTDVNEVPSISASTYTIAENASEGAAVGTKTGTDVDGDTLTYTITAGNDGGLFAINSGSGAITVASGLNHETASSHSLTVQAADAALSATATVTVTVSDVNEVPSISASSYTIAENASVGATVGTKTGTDVDDDTLAYTITAGNDGGLFAINSGSGAITVASGLNHETASSHSLTVQAADAALSATATVTVTVSDVNETPSISASTFTIAENASVNDAVGTKTGTDVDDDTLTYTITEGNDGGLFAINSGSGAITVASGLNHETASSHSLTVQAADAALSATATVTVNVTDVNEVPSISASSFTIAEDASVGATVGTKTGTDVDDDTLAYTITAGNDGGLFAINSGSGAITVASGLNHETASSHSLTVQAADAAL